MKKFMGRHLIIDAYGVEKKKLTNKKFLTGFLENLPKELNMRIVRKPIVNKIFSDKYLCMGFSGFVIIYESHISFHTWPEENYIALDVYSCNDFSEKRAIKYIKRYFETNDMKIKSIMRG